MATLSPTGETGPVYRFLDADWAPQGARRSLERLAAADAGLLARLQAQVGDPAELGRVLELVESWPTWSRRGRFRGAVPRRRQPERLPQPFSISSIGQNDRRRCEMPRGATLFKTMVSTEKRRECERELQQAKDLLDSWRPLVQRQERELVDGEARLVESELQVEKLEDALASIRTGRAYKLMRIAWRLRAPFRRDKA